METPSKLEIWEEWREFLELFLSEKVEFLIVGGVALAAHGEPRWTGDLDVLVRPTSDNAKSILKALDKFGFGSLGLKIEDWLTEGRVIQLGREPRRIDILTSITGVNTDEAFETGIQITLLDLTLPIIGREQLIQNKRATQRERDLRDVEVLERNK